MSRCQPRGSGPRRLTVAIVLGVAVALLVPSGALASGLFSRLPGEMHEGRYAPAAAALPDGKVLIAGGYSETSALKSAEIYDPASGTFELLAAELLVPHDEQATVALPDGQVLIVGGWNSTSHSLKSVELFSPVTRTFEKLPAEMGRERDGPGATLLAGGKVLIVGGAPSSGEYVKSAEIFDPATRTFQPVAGVPVEARYQPVVVTLPNGKVLISGGYTGSPTNLYLQTAELFDPATGTFTRLEGAGHEPTEKRDEAGGVTMHNGRVLIAGGYNNVSRDLATVEAFDYATNTFEKLSSELSEPRDGSAATVLPDGRMLVVAGYNEALPVKSRYLTTIDGTAAVAATVTTAAATAVSYAAATLQGTVLSESAASTYYQYGTSAAYGAVTPRQAIGYAIGPQAIAATAGALSPSTPYHYRLVAENAAGVSYGADQTFTTAAPPPSPPPAPVVGAVSQLHERWREGSGLARISRRVPVGTTFSFTLNVPATVSFTFTQVTAGRKVHGRCVALAPGNRGAHACRRTVARGTLPFPAHAGKNVLAFQGRLSRTKRLRPGTYAVSITARGTSGTSAARRLTFTIVR